MGKINQDIWMKLRKLGKTGSDTVFTVDTHLSDDLVASEEDAPEWGNQEERAIGMEVSTAAANLTGGADAVIMRHPAAVATIKKFITELV